MKVKYYLILPLLIFFIYLFGCSTGQYSLKNEEVNKDSLNKPIKATYDTSLRITTIPQKRTPILYRIRTAPTFTLQVNGNFDYGLAELSSPYETVYEADQLLKGQNFGVRRGFGGFIMGKFPLEKEGNVRLTFIGAFNYFKNSNLSSFISTSGSVKYNTASVGVGIENSFTPSYKIKPYISVSLMANLIWGEANNIVNPNSSTTNIKFKKSFRIGYIISSGLEILVSNRVGMNMGISLVDANRILKASNTSDDPNEFTLRDKKDKDNEPPLPLSGYKQFLYTSFYVGVNIYFGIKNKLYKL